MEFIYILIAGQWEDMVVFLSEEDAIKESINQPHHRVEIFSKNNNSYIPTYSFYKNGECITFE